MKDYNKILQLSSFGVGEYVGDAVYIVNKDGHIVDANEICGDLLGICKDDIIGKTVSQLWEMNIFELKNNFFFGYSDIKVPELLSMLNKVNLEEYNLEHAPILSDLAFKEKKTVCGVTRTCKTRKVVLYVCIPMFSTSGEIDYVTSVARDLTEIIELKNKISNVQSNLEYYKKLQFEDTFIGDSQPMRQVKYMISQIADIDATVLINGETGTGKEVVAREIFKKSSRKDKPYIRINCAAIPENLFESEIFGYEKGAFTGALSKRKVGLLEMANGGTVLLDEIEELPLLMQSKILRTLQECEIVRVGGSENVKIDVRFIATTNKNLETMIANNQFRQDLFYRLNVFSINMPPLRERGDDIETLSWTLLKRFNEKYKKIKNFTPSAIARLKLHDWPGNVRDLEHTVERLVVIGEGNNITEEEVELSISGERIFEKCKLSSLQHAVDVTEKRVIENAVKKYKSSRKVAEALGVSQPTILRKAKKLGIKI